MNESIRERLAQRTMNALLEQFWTELGRLAWGGQKHVGRGVLFIDARYGEDHAKRFSYYTLEELRCKPEVWTELEKAEKLIEDAVRTYDPERSAVLVWIPDDRALLEKLQSKADPRIDPIDMMLSLEGFAEPIIRILTEVPPPPDC